MSDRVPNVSAVASFADRSTAETICAAAKAATPPTRCGRAKTIMRMARTWTRRYRSAADGFLSEEFWRAQQTCLQAAPTGLPVQIAASTEILLRRASASQLEDSARAQIHW